MVTSIIIAAGHLHITVSFAFITLLLSVVLGFLFIRHKNIWGVSIVHFCIGAIGIKLGLL
jgi:membrane protease YdiL (CAAX protease family)